MIRRYQDFFSLNLLILIALAVDLIFPFLIWKGVVPSSTRWLSHAAVALMMGLVYARLMVRNRIPGIVWLIVGGSIIWASVALLNGQGWLPTAWGWWVMFQYPLVGLFAYLENRWPRNFPELLIWLCIGILALELVFQIGQYFTGTTPGDNLAGTFGQKGTGNLAILILLVLCLALGEWIAERHWKEMLLVLFLGIASSVLAEIKLFLFAGLLLMVLSVVLYSFRYARVWRLIPYSLLLGMMVLGFVRLYDELIPGTKTTSIERFLQDPKSLAEYLAFSERNVVGGSYYYNLGRNARLELGWNAIRGDPMTLLFGMGLGARGESVTLGTEGMSARQGQGIVGSSSLLVMLQELGLGGLAILACLYLWLIITLFRRAVALESSAAGLAYALLLFSLFWPLWLWYNSAWTLRVPMLVYWVVLGYVLGQSQRDAAGAVMRASVSRQISREATVER